MAAYDRIFESVVSAAFSSGDLHAAAEPLQQSITAAQADDKHVALNESIVQFHNRDALTSDMALPEM